MDCSVNQPSGPNARLDIQPASAFSILRPLVLFYLQVEVGPMVERVVELNAVNLVVLTVLTVVLGVILVTIAIQEAMEIRVLPQ